MTSHSKTDKLDVNSFEKCTAHIRSVIKSLINVCVRKEGARPLFVSCEALAAVLCNCLHLVSDLSALPRMELNLRDCVLFFDDFFLSFFYQVTDNFSKVTS